jgi:hypothetical protein
MSWDRDDTERWLSDYPLPRTMTFRGEIVWPSYHLKKGYGFWLRTAGPYHKQMRGLFVLIHEFLSAVPTGQPMPTSEILADRVRAWEQMQAELPLSDEDQAAPASTNPASGPDEPGDYCDRVAEGMF